MEQAAKALSEGGKIPGFRPGHAPYETVAKHFGEMAIYETAGEKAIPQFLSQTIQEEKIEIVGQPQIEVEKLAPGNPFVFKAMVWLRPSVKLAPWQKMKIPRQKKIIEPAQVDKVMEDLRKMRASEALVERPAGSSDKIVIDLEIFQDKAPVEGGQAKDHVVYLAEDYYLPGLPQELVGLKKGDVKEFSLVFPETHYQKHLAGKKADFKVTAKDVYERHLPTADDVFAQGFGQKTLAELRQLVENNLKSEAGQKEEQRLEAELLNQLVQKSDFGELPTVLIEAEKKQMLEELKQGLSQMKIGLEDYLKDLKKTEQEVARDFEKGARERIKISLVLREIARQEKIGATEVEMKEEVARLRNLYKEDSQIEERLAEPTVLEHLQAMYVNQKVMKMLKEKMVE